MCSAGGGLKSSGVPAGLWGEGREGQGPIRSGRALTRPVAHSPGAH